MFIERPIAVELISDLVKQLEPSSVRWGGLKAAGKWGVLFKKRDDVLFCWLDKGQCLLLRCKGGPTLLRAGDFVLIRSAESFALASSAEAPLADSETLTTASRSTWLDLCAGAEPETLLHAGRFGFNTEEGDSLIELLPMLTHLPAECGVTERVRNFLRLVQPCSGTPDAISLFINNRLLELALVEILRTHSSYATTEPTTLLSFLEEPSIARSLRAMHADVKRPWTVKDLAQVAGVSRSSFALSFLEHVGVAPMRYLRNWRMVLAKRYLRGKRYSVEQIADLTGYRSSSAFSTAFHRETGLSPQAFRDLSDNDAEKHAISHKKPRSERERTRGAFSVTTRRIRA